jgi:WD40 repeat protein
VTAFAVSPKESHLAVAETEEIGATATASARGSASPSVKLWDVKTKTAVTLRSRRGAGTMGTTSAMTFASDGSHLATADGATVRVWDLQGAEFAKFVLPAPVAQLAFSQDGHRVVAVANRHVYVFPWDDGELLKTVCRSVGRDLTKKEWAQYVPNEPYIGVCEKDLAAAAAAR